MNQRSSEAANNSRNFFCRPAIIITVFIVLLFPTVAAVLWLAYRRETVTFHVDLAHLSGLKKGATVRIAGVDAGSVQEISFLSLSILNEEEITEYGEDKHRPGADVTHSSLTPTSFSSSQHSATTRSRSALAAPAPTSVPTETPRAHIRLQIQVYKELASLIKEDSACHVSLEQKGLLPRWCLEITPGSPASPTMQEGAVLATAWTPPDPGKLLHHTELLIDEAVALVLEHPGETRALAANLSEFLARTNHLLDKSGPSFEATASLLEGTISDAATIMAYIKERTERGREIDHLISQSSYVLGVLTEDLPSLRNDTFRLMNELANASSLLHTMLTKYDPELGPLLLNLNNSITSANLVLRDTSDTLNLLKSNRNTVGMLLTDRKLYDNLDNLLIDFRQQPWRVLYKEDDRR